MRLIRPRLRYMTMFLAALTGSVSTLAAELPAEPAPVKYLRTCNAFGVGFYIIPGTDTCMRVSGRLRADYNIFDYDPLFAQTQGPNGTYSRTARRYRYRARVNLYVDSRTSTEFGLLRTFADVQFQVDTPTFGSLPSEGSSFLSSGYIQFGGFTFGRAQSQYDYVDGFFAPGQAFLVAVSDVTTQLAAYTQDFADGFSATVSLEDESPRRSGLAAAPQFRSGYGGNRFPDIVANVRAEGVWGDAQVMGALHNVRAFSVSESQLGFAVGGGLTRNLAIARGMLIGGQASYAKGALQYIGSSLAGGRIIDGVFYGTNDGIIDSSGQLELSEGASVMAGLSARILNNTSLSFEAGYTIVDQPEVDLAGDGTPDDLDFQSFGVDGFLGYSPASGFLVGVGAQYKHVDMAAAEDFGGLSTFFRAQRLF